MNLHESTFEYLKPTPEQVSTMGTVRALFKAFAEQLDSLLPNGTDKAFVMRDIRTAAMWANVTITRYEDGTPREDASPQRNIW